jgi:hypothetical protein
VADATNPMDQSDEHLLQRQFTTVFEYLINVSGFELPFILVLLDADDSVVGSKIIRNGEHEDVLSTTDFIPPVSPIFTAVREKRCKAVYTPARRSPTALEYAPARG